MTDQTHIPVLLEETIQLLSVQPGKWYVDMTFGRGGHTQAILNQGGFVLALDVDADAIAWGTRTFTKSLEKKQLILVRENFQHVDEVIGRQESQVQSQIFGAIADFGVSSPQLEQAERGFSFQSDAPLDMRMDQRLSVTAADLLNGLGKNELIDLLSKYGGEHHAKTIAFAIVNARKQKAIQTTRELALLLEHTIPREGQIHQATKTFMALRMLVNDELNVIKDMLPKAFTMLASNGILVTIAFQENEDRFCKHFMVQMETEEKGQMLTKKPIQPGDVEVAMNPRSRSAKLRGVRKI